VTRFRFLFFTRINKEEYLSRDPGALTFVEPMPILERGQYATCVSWMEVFCVVKESAQSQENSDRDGEVARRRAVLADVYDTLPSYGSMAFWRTVEEPDLQAAVPLEVLVRCVRTAIARGDDEGRNRILEVIFQRTHMSNEYWANSILKTAPLEADERKALVNDLYADLCECFIRAVIDEKRSFWEENFQHCLMFERKHVYRSFMRREGRWNSLDGKRSERIPRMLVASLDQPAQLTDGDTYELDIEDEKAQKALLAVEQADIPGLILRLPDRLKPIVLLIFWEGRTEKDTAQLLGITDRTVRNRLREAFKLLHTELEPEREFARQ
jgi:DNA-directed RNA polymerase specialized sigma24 family protein